MNTPLNPLNRHPLVAHTSAGSDRARTQQVCHTQRAAIAAATWVTALVGVFSASAHAAEINVYSARHYPSDTALYAGFTKQTGIRINRVDSNDAGILARLKAEGKHSKADVVLLVDATRLWRADQDGLFAPVQSSALNAAIPAQFRSSPTDTSTWFGFSSRARIVVFDQSQFKASDFDDYEKLASPIAKGKLCIRSGSHPYNLSLFSSLLHRWGETKTEAWLSGLVRNMARAPKGGDTDQIKGVASGECGVAVTNSYYLARLMRSDDPAQRAIAEKVGVVFPNATSWGTHINIAGGAVAKHSAHASDAVRFLEYLATPEAQRHFADGNNEWPLAQTGAAAPNDALRAMVPQGLVADPLPIRDIGQNVPAVQRMLDRVGFQ